MRKTQGGSQRAQGITGDWNGWASGSGLKVNVPKWTRRVVEIRKQGWAEEGGERREREGRSETREGEKIEEEKI